MVKHHTALSPLMLSAIARTGFSGALPWRSDRRRVWGTAPPYRSIAATGTPSGGGLAPGEDRTQTEFA